MKQFDSGIATSETLSTSDMMNVLIEQPLVKSCDVLSYRCIAVTLKWELDLIACSHLTEHLQRLGIRFETNKPQEL